MRLLASLFVLARMTAVEILREPVVLLLTVTCVGLTAVTPMLLLHTFGEYGKLAREGGLAFHFVFGLLLAAHAASGAMSREVRSGTAAVVLSKPVGRGLFFLSKFLGVAVVVLIFSVAALLATLLAERVAERWTVTATMTAEVIDWRTGRWLLGAPLLALGAAGVLNYRWRRPFASTALLLIIASLALVLVTSGFFDRAGARAPFAWGVDWRLIPAGVLMTTALTLIAAVAVSVSTRLGDVPTASACGLLFAAGVLWEHLWAGHHPAGLLAILYGLVPAWQQFWVSDALTGGGVIPWSYVGQVGLSAMVYIGAVLCLGSLAFRSADV